MKEVKLLLKDLSEDPHMYRSWQNYLKASVVACHSGPVFAQIWIEEIENMTISLSSLTSPAQSQIKRVDVRLYVCILGAIKGPKL